MSADNGVYILETPGHPDPTKKQYRVIHAQAIENVTSYDPLWNQDECARDYFGKCQVFHDESEAFQEAQRIYDEIMKDDFCPIVEYGISFIQLTPNRPFPCD